MGVAPTEGEVKMFIIFTIALTVFALIMAVFSMEFTMGGTLDQPNLDAPDDVSGGRAFSIGVASFMAMFLPISFFIDFIPSRLAVIITLMQIIYYYLLYAVLIKPWIPDWL
jgi:hypothetical protein